jgi:hypothetical protein
METFVVRVVTNAAQPMLAGFIQHVGSRPGTRFRGSDELLAVIEAHLRLQSEVALEEEGAESSQNDTRRRPTQEVSS